MTINIEQAALANAEALVAAGHGADVAAAALGRNMPGHRRGKEILNSGERRYWEQTSEAAREELAGRLEAAAAAIDAGVETGKIAGEISRSGGAPTRNSTPCYGYAGREWYPGKIRRVGTPAGSDPGDAWNFWDGKMLNVGYVPDVHIHIPDIPGSWLLEVGWASSEGLRWAAKELRALTDTATEGELRPVLQYG